jgi:hypothetical protein
MDARAAYEKGKEERTREVAAREGSSRSLGALRLVVFAGMIVLVGAIIWVPLPSTAWLGELALVLGFATLVVIHARVEGQKQRARAGLRFHERGLARLDGKWIESPSKGERFKNVDHPYTDDVDVFGHASLFQLLDTTETRFGEERLAAQLSRTTLGAWPVDIAAQQEAVRDLAPRIAFRERLSALGSLLGAEKPDPRPFLEWAEGKPTVPHGPAIVWGARILPMVVVALLAAVPIFPQAKPAAIALIVLELVVMLVLRGQVSKIAAVVSAREAGMVRYAEMLEAIETEKLEAPLLKRLQSRLAASGSSATTEMRALGRVVAFLDARNNEVFRFLIGPLLLWDLNCVVALERWRERTGKGARAWFEVLGEVEALASLAAFAFDRPDHAWPKLASSPSFEAKGLGHPMIPADRRVDNDVALEGPGHGLIVTGSNMSGKSTLLRAMGINAVLALAGAPVCAKELSIGQVRVATSMRIRDSLEQGVSHFYAELQKLKRVLDMSKEGGTVMFLLDEILHGTNSRERIIGARAIIKELLARGAMGAVSTHDLGISDLEQEIAKQPGEVSVENVHFEEQVEGDKMTFDYRLRSGIVQSSNALRLMKLVGIDVAP